MLNLLIAFVALLYLSLMTALIWSRVWFGVKALLILSTLVVTGLSVWVIRDVQGTPANKTLPKEFLLAMTLVREPDVTRDDKGAIYYVIIQNKDGVGVPRTYQRPYSTSRHQQTSKIQSAIDKAHKPVWVQSQDDDLQASGTEPNGSAGTAKKLNKQLKKAAKAFGLYEDDSGSTLQLQDSNPLPPKE